MFLTIFLRGIFMPAVIPDVYDQAIVTNNLKNLGEFNTLTYQGAMQDWQRARTMMQDNALQIQKQQADVQLQAMTRLANNAENLQLRAIKPIIEPDQEEANALVTMRTGIDPLSQGFHSSSMAMQLANAQATVNALVGRIAALEASIAATQGK